jgi:AbiV family abortive infection protein
MIPNVAASTPRRKRRLPTPEEAFAGIPLALENAERHLRSADLLAGKGEHGQATAHVVLSLEETDKARVLGMLWLDEDDLTEDQARARLFDHRTRNEAASRSPGLSACC